MSLNYILKKRYGFNLKERLYVLGGGLAGIITPITVSRYLAFPQESDSLGQELTKWGMSALFSIIPMVATIPVGFGIGSLAAFKSRRKRVTKEQAYSEQNLEKKVK